MAVWEKEGWGVTNDCLQMVIDNYRTQGTEDRHSLNVLESYLRRLTPPAFKVMFEYDRTVTAQMIVDVLGVDKLLDVYNVFMQEPGNKENARELRQRIEKLEQENRKLADSLSVQRDTALEREEDYSKEAVIWRETEENLKEQIETATAQLEKSKLEIVRLKAEIYDILSKNGDI